MLHSTQLHNIYQLSGLDDRERGFTRQVESTYREGAYHVVLRYERVRFDEKSASDERSALQNLIETLHTQGYTQLRSQLIFSGETYLGSQELWIEYPDAEKKEKERWSIIDRIQRWFKREKTQKSRDSPLGRC